MDKDADVNSIITTQEVAAILKLSPQYVLTLAKSMKIKNKLSDKEFRYAGKRTCLFNITAQEKIQSELVYTPNKK